MMRAPSPGAQLHRVAAVSAQIRELSRQAGMMQMHATNAIISARSQGTHVPGFEVVSDQMRQLSRALVACLKELRTANVGWLAVVSRAVAHERAVAALAETARASPRAARAVEAILPRVRDEDGERRSAVAARRAFGRVLDDARQLAATGCVLSRTAKLEATHGGALADKLAHTAEDFSVLADSVNEAVRTIARRLADDRGSFV